MPIGQATCSLCVVSNGVTPYGLHFLSRVAAELPNVALTTIYSYEHSMGKWKLHLPASINAVVLGQGQSPKDGTPLTRLIRGVVRGRQIVSLLERQRPSAVLILGYGSIAHRVALNWCSRQRIACLLWADSNIHGDRTTGVRAILKRRVVHRVVKRCCAILPCGSLGRDYYLKYGASREQIFFVPNEPDYSLFERPSNAVIETVGRKYGLDRTRRRIVFSGRLIALKRVDLLIKAFAGIAEQRPDWDLLVVGDGDCRGTLEESAPAMLRHRIHWAGYIDNQAELGGIYNWCDVLALPSSYEAWALVVNEAAAAGLALVTSDVVGAAPELVRNNVNGFTFPTGDLHALTQRLLDVTHPEQINRMRKASPEVLAEWRRYADPVAGLRRALIHCGALTSS